MFDLGTVVPEMGKHDLDVVLRSHAFSIISVDPVFKQSKQFLLDFDLVIKVLDIVHLSHMHRPLRWFLM